MNKTSLAFLIALMHITGNVEATETLNPEKISSLTGSAADEVDAAESTKVANKFLEDLDRQQYGESWEEASIHFKKAMPKEEWITAMDLMRKPLGELKNRKLGDQRTVQDPANHPKGEYMVMFYRTAFEKNSDSYELLTLIKEEGQWKVFTYNVY